MILYCNIVLAHDIIIRQHMVNYSNVRFIILRPFKKLYKQEIKDEKDGVCVYLVYEMKHLTHYTIHNVTWDVNVIFVMLLKSI